MRLLMALLLAAGFQLSASRPATVPSHAEAEVPGLAPQGEGIRGGRRGYRQRGRGIRSAYRRAGRSAARGGARFGKSIARGRPVRAGKGLGKGVGGFGKHTGVGTARVGKRIGRGVKRVF